MSETKQIIKAYPGVKLAEESSWTGTHPGSIAAAATERLEKQGEL